MAQDKPAPKPTHTVVDVATPAEIAAAIRVWADSVEKPTSATVSLSHTVALAVADALEERG